MTTKPSVILFDVNETMMNMKPLKKELNELLGARGFRIWFNMLLHYSLVDNCTQQYHDFSAIAGAAFDMTANSLAIKIKEKHKTDALSRIKHLKAYPDVPKGLKLLLNNGYRLATLTNSPETTLLEQLEYSSLTGFFEKTLSVDAIRKYKPSPETYHWAAEQMRVNVKEIIMVAAHGWDIIGAIQAGLQTAFIERKGQSLYPLAVMPLYKGKDLLETAKAIINKNKIEMNVS